MQKGEIFFHKNLEFFNGEFGKKLLVLLNTPKKQENYIFCKTTSQEKERPKVPGCHPNKSLFFIPAGQEFLNENTWIQLEEFHQFHATTVLQHKWKGYLERKGKLQDLTIRQIINCIKKLKDIEENVWELIKK